MTLSDLTLPIDYETAKGYALVFSVPLAQRLGQLHAEFGNPNLVPMPVTLTDGRLILCGDILTECGPDGLLEAMWNAADKNVLLPAVEVLPWGDIVPFLPPPSPEPAAPPPNPTTDSTAPPEEILRPSDPPSETQPPPSTEEGT